MNKIEFVVDGRIISTFHDAAVVLTNEDPLDSLVEQAVQSISTSVMVTCGGVTMHLAAWQDPDHWEDDWREKGIDPDDVHGLVSAQMVSS